MKAAFLAVIVLLATGCLYAWATTPILPASAHAVQSFDAPSSGSVWWVGASSTDSSALPNTGVQGKIQVISTSVVGCLAFWVSDDLSNGVWGQVGYEICDTSTPVAFYQIWNLGTNAVLTSGTSSVSTGSHAFSMYLQSGTTWAYSLDGTVFGTYDMGANSSSSSYPVYALSEEEGSGTFAFPTVEFSTAMQVMKSGTWSSVQTAKSYGTGWGVVGAAQGTGLQANQITVGGSLAVLPQGTQLWDTGTTSTTSSSSTSTSSPTSTTSTVTLPPTTSTVTSTATSTPTSTVKSTATSTAASTTARTTKSTETSPTTTTSKVTTTQTSTGTVTSISTVTSPTTSANRTVTTTSMVTSSAVTSTPTTTQTSASTVTSISTGTLPHTTTAATQTTATTDTQTAASAVPSTGTATGISSGTPATSETCSNGTGSLSDPSLSKADTPAVLPSIDGGSVLVVLAASLTCLALVVHWRANSLVPKSPKIRAPQSGPVPRPANSLFEGRKDDLGNGEQR